MRKISAEGIKELKIMEGIEPYIYTCSAGAQTIGAGHKLSRVEMDTGTLIIDGKEVRWINGLTKEQIDGLLRKDLEWVELAINDSVKVPLSDSQFDCLCAFVFNVGASAFKSSTLLKKLNKGDYLSVPDELRRWNKITVRMVRDDGTWTSIKKISPGLIHRREAEIKLWLTP